MSGREQLAKLSWDPAIGRSPVGGERPMVRSLSSEAAACAYIQLAPVGRTAVPSRPSLWRWPTADAVERAALGHVLDLHLVQLTLDELVREYCVSGVVSSG
jgi:hypothetical protein